MDLLRAFTRRPESARLSFKPVRSQHQLPLASTQQEEICKKKKKIKTKNEEKMPASSHVNRSQQHAEYWRMVQGVDRHRLKFCDEKLILGGSRWTRRCPLTGHVDAYVVDPSNVASAIGICGLASPNPSIPIDYYVHTNKNDSTVLSWCVMQSVAKGFLRPYDVLVFDNKRIHRSRELCSLQEWLYETHRICVVFLPLGAASLNPMKRIWKILDQGLDACSLGHPWVPNRVVSEASVAILRSISHTIVHQAYQQCGY